MWSDSPVMKSRAFFPGPTHGWPYNAVGMHSAEHSPIGRPSSPTSAPSMVGFVTPPD